MKNIAKLLFPAFSTPKSNGKLDALTGVWSNNTFEQLSEIAFKAANDTEQPMSIIVCDVDNLTQITNKHGYSTANQVLKLFTAIVCSEIDTKGELGRLSSGRFAIALPNTTLENASLMGESIRRAFASMRLNGPLADEKFSASLGVASMTGDTIASAEVALDAAQLSNGNCTRLSADYARQSSNGGTAEAYRLVEEDHRKVA